MSDDEALQRRLRAVERSLTDGDHDVDSLRAAGDQADRLEELAARLADAEDRIAELEASTQALRGYVGNVRSVNEDVEQRADAALAGVERLEERFDGEAQPASRDRKPHVRGMDGRQPRVNSPDRQREDARAGANGDSGYDGDDGDGLVARLRSAL